MTKTKTISIYEFNQLKKEGFTIRQIKKKFKIDILYINLTKETDTKKPLNKVKKFHHTHKNKQEEKKTKKYIEETFEDIEEIHQRMLNILNDKNKSDIILNDLQEKIKKPL